MQAAVAGQGVALGQSVIVGDDPAAGHLLRPFKLRVPSGMGHYLAALPEPLSRAPVVAFHGCLKHELADASSRVQTP